MSCMLHVQAPAGGDMSSMIAAPALPAPPSVQQMAMQDVPAGAPAMPPQPDASTGISPDARVPAPLAPILCTKTCTVLHAFVNAQARGFTSRRQGLSILSK